MMTALRHIKTPRASSAPAPLRNAWAKERFGGGSRLGARLHAMAHVFRMHGVTARLVGQLMRLLVQASCHPRQVGRDRAGLCGAGLFGATRAVRSRGYGNRRNFRTLAKFRVPSAMMAGFSQAYAQRMN